MRPSALRFWEQQRLLQPDRERFNGYRVYREDQLLRLQIVVILRRLGQRAPVIRSALDQVAAGRMGPALEALRDRQRALVDASRACMEATVSLRAYLRTRGLPPLESRVRASCQTVHSPDLGRRSQRASHRRALQRA